MAELLGAGRGMHGSGRKSGELRLNARQQGRAITRLKDSKRKE